MRRHPVRRAAAAGAVAAAALALAPVALAGDGGLTPGPTFPVTDPVSMGVGDFNRDGRPDVAVVSARQKEKEGVVRILLNDGTGSFNAAPDVAAGADPGQLVVGDFDNDGEDDLAITNQADKDVSIRLGTGGGRFGGAVPDLAVGGRVPRALVTGDFNADNREDLAISAGDASGGNVYLRLGSPAGGFVDGPTVANVLAPLVVEDFDGDAIEDLAAGDLIGTGGRYLRGAGAAAFASPVNLGLPLAASLTAPHGLASGDFNGDGRRDLVTVMRDVVSVRMSPQGPLAGGADLMVPGEHRAVAVGDLDGDRRDDVVVARCGSGGGLVVLRDNGTTGLAADPIRPYDGLCDVAIADLDGDGVDDVIGADRGTGRVLVLKGTGNGELQGNLVVNGGFEGAGSGRNVSDFPAIPGWQRTGNVTSIRYGFGAGAFFPTRLESPRLSGGNALLWGGDSRSTGGTTQAFQTVDVSAAAAAIDGGRSAITLSAWLGGALDVPDVMSARAEFVSASGAVLGRVELAGVTAADRRNMTTLLRREGSGTVPVGTRRITVRLISADADTTLSSATADNVRLTLRQGPPAPGGAGGPGAGGGGQAGGDGVAPRIAGVRLSKAAFPVARRGKAGTVVRFTLSEDATVTLRVERRVAGRRVRHVPVKGTLVRTGRAGANRILLDGRLGGRALAAGRYRVRLVAADAAGNRSAPATRAFRITVPVMR